MRYLWSGDWDIRKYCENQMWGTQHRTPEMIFHLAESGGETFTWIPGGGSLSWAGSNGNWSWKHPCPEVLDSCPVVKNWKLLNTCFLCLPFALSTFCFVQRFPNVKMPPRGGSRGNNQCFQTRLLVLPEMPKTFLLKCQWLLSLCASWRAQECALQVKSPLALPKKKIPRRFNKASGAEGWQQFMSCE